MIDWANSPCPDTNQELSRAGETASMHRGSSGSQQASRSRARARRRRWVGGGIRRSEKPFLPWLGWSPPRQPRDECKLNAHGETRFRSNLPVTLGVTRFPHRYVAQVSNLCPSPRRSGLPMPVAGRSPRPSRPRLSACPLRFAILASLASIARLSGTGSPSLAHVAQVGNLCLPLAQVFNLCRMCRGLKTCATQSL